MGAPTHTTPDRRTRHTYISYRRHPDPAALTRIQRRYGDRVVLRVRGGGEVDAAGGCDAVRVAAAVEKNVARGDGGAELLYVPDQM